MAPPEYNAEGAKAALKAMGGSILFEKVLTSSDANGTGRLVIPKGQAEAHLPFLEEQQGTTLHATDPEGAKHSFRFRFWVNNQSSRMYLLEDTMGVQQKYGLSAGDVLVFAKMEDGTYGVCGRKGTKDDVSRKPGVRRNSSGALAAEGSSPGEGGRASGKRQRSRGVADSAKSKRLKQKQGEQAVQSLFSYWSASSLPMRKDGVFRAVPNSALQEGDKVVAQFGAWSAIVSVGGEMFQAFFDTHEAANAAFEAARQSRGKGAAEAPAPASQARQPASAEPLAAAAAAVAGAAKEGAAAAAGAGKASPGGSQGAAGVAGEADAQHQQEQRQQQQQEQQPDVKEEQPQQQAS